MFHTILGLIDEASQLRDELANLNGNKVFLMAENKVVLVLGLKVPS